MLTAKGHSTRFVIESGRSVRARGALLHDESGQWWSSNSGLVMPFVRTRKPLEDRTARKHFGDDYDIREGYVDLPPQPLDEWRLVGPIREAFYVRTGNIEPGPKQHEFGERPIFFLPAHRLPDLYVRRGVHRIELHSGTRWDWAGFRG